MSTRCHILIESAKEPEQKIFVYRHYDGYPEGVGKELVKFLKTYQITHNDWDNRSIAFGLANMDDQYEIDDEIHGDEEYVYVIDCENQKLTCYEYDDDFGDEVLIPGNIFQDGKRNEEVNFTHDQYIQVYSAVLRAIIPQFGDPMSDENQDRCIKTAKQFVDKTFELFGKDL